MTAPSEFENEKSLASALLQSFPFDTGGHSFNAVVSNVIFGDAANFHLPRGESQLFLVLSLLVIVLPSDFEIVENPRNKTF